MIFPFPFIQDILETELCYELLAQGSGLGNWDFMERLSTRKCEQLELHVIVAVCCWRNFCLDCSSDSCLDVLEWKSAPNVPREKAQNCQKTLSFLSPRILNLKGPHSPTTQKIQLSNHSTVQYHATENKTSNSPPKSAKVRPWCIQLPRYTCHALRDRRAWL